ncbi:MAG: tripartite tricarboxylate transporter substrate-binding protein [Beijerinckiaceae bacterium]|nr:tripartite tricarboxylate transporter substrate-binding protein [Beijerinckiaceae bacterium]
MRTASLAYAAAAGAVLALAPLAPANAQSADTFFAGKDVRILIGAAVGGTYGLYAQLAARHMREHIPGKPNLILQSMPGAGGLIGLNYSYNVAPKDGTLMHLVHAEVLYETLLTREAKFDAQGYQWIGRIADADSLILSTRNSKLTTFDEAKSREPILGSTGIANIYALGPLLLNRVAGTKFKIIGGYKGSSDIIIAMERGEVDGAGMTLANAMTIHGDKIKNGDFKPYLALSAKRLAAFPDIPAMTEFGSGPSRLLMDIYASTGTIGRALAYPPGVPGDRVQVMRDAFQKMVKDPAFIAETKKSNIIVAPMSGEDLTAEIARVMKTPKEQVDAARQIHEDLLKSSK